MRIIIFKSIFVVLILITLPNQIYADTALDFYMNDFYFKFNKAKQILKDIEITLKEGSREKVCSRQREAARLGLSANKSLIKAFELNGTIPPMDSIRASQKRWEAILNEC